VQNWPTFPLVKSHPIQPPKVEPPALVAVSVTDVPLWKLALQLVAQLIPGGELMTVPVPPPAKRIVSVGPLVKQMTFAVIVPVTIAPEDDRPPEL